MPLVKLEITDNGKEFDDDVVTNEGLDHMCSTKCIAYVLLQYILLSSRCLIGTLQTGGSYPKVSLTDSKPEYVDTLILVSHSTFVTCHMVFIRWRREHQIRHTATFCNL